MLIRNLNTDDLHTITQIARFGLPYDEITTKIINEKTLASKDFTADLSIGCEIDSILAGFAIGSIGVAGKACVRILVVSPQFRNQGIGSFLLQTLEQRFAEKGVKTVSVGDCPINYLTPGMDFRHTEGWCFLLKHKYEKTHTNHNLIAPISTSLWPQLPDEIAKLQQEDGIVVRRAQDGDLNSIYRLLDENWAGWRNEVDNSFANTPISLHVALQKDTCLAFAGYQGNNKDLAWFGPMGTDPVTRGKGIGGILLRLCLLDLAGQGFTQAIIPWVGPIRFYSRYAEAKIDRIFYVFSKNI